MKSLWMSLFVVASGLATTPVLAQSNGSDRGASPAPTADWYCEAYCYQSGRGMALIFDHGGHQVDTLNELVERCLQISGNYGNLHSGPTSSNPEANIANSCRMLSAPVCE